MSDDEEVPPWRATGVKGIVPPGRKLPDQANADAPWRATGVGGIRVTDNQASAPAQDRWKMNRGAKTRPRPVATRAQKPKSAPQNPSGAKDSSPSIKDFLDDIAAFIREHPPAPECSESLAELIRQSQAPYEIIIGFTILSTVVGQDSEMRNKYAWVLERGARAYFNLAMRLDKTIKPPRGLVPQRLDPLFYDLPATAFQIPFAFGTDSFLRIIDLLQRDVPYNRILIEHAQKLYDTHIQPHHYGDQSLTELFSWQAPDWAPKSD
jgi:hypothetical protein